MSLPNPLVREYTPADLPAMNAIWNAVVEAGDASARHLNEKLGFEQLGTIRGGFRMKDGTYANICPYWHAL